MSTQSGTESMSNVDNVYSDLDKSIESLSSVVQSIDKLESSNQQISQQMSDYNDLMDQDSFYDTDSRKNNLESVNEDFTNETSYFSYSKCCIIIVIAIFLILGFIYFMKLKREKNKLKNVN